MDEVATEISLDLRGLKCPLPALRTRRALNGLAGGRILVVETTDPMAVIDIPNVVRECGGVVLDQKVAAGEARFRLRAGTPSG